ncbi:MAG TPA: hypothetical protein VND89_04360 [Acidimicrobiales bacterium]|nr:hypothetical protein [Acidimicrobiales bacterium]
MATTQRIAATRALRRLTSLALALVVSAALPVVVLSRPSAAGAAETTTTLAASCSAVSPESTTLSLEVNGFSRTVIVHVPRGSSGSTPMALVLNLHGSGSTALEQEELSDMNATANAAKFIAAYPQALIPDGSGFDWNVPGVSLFGGRAVPAKSANDLTFLKKLVGILEQKYCVNSSEVYATGLSGGAREASQLACDDSSLFAAIAPVSGLRRPTPCPTKRAVPVITFHGSAGRIDPFGGQGQAYWTYSVTTAAKYWAQQDRCSTKPTKSTPEPTVDLTTYSGCSNGAAVELYEIKGEGHEWPGGRTLPSGITQILGPQSNLISANELMWAFFGAHPLG